MLTYFSLCDEDDEFAALKQQALQLKEEKKTNDCSDEEFQDFQEYRGSQEGEEVQLSSSAPQKVSVVTRPDTMPHSSTADSLVDVQAKSFTPSMSSSGYGSQAVSTQTLSSEDSMSVRSMSIEEPTDADLSKIQRLESLDVMKLAERAAAISRGEPGAAAPAVGDGGKISSSSVNEKDIDEVCESSVAAAPDADGPLEQDDPSNGGGNKTEIEGATSDASEDQSMTNGRAEHSKQNPKNNVETTESLQTEKGMSENSEKPNAGNDSKEPLEVASLTSIEEKVDNEVKVVDGVKVAEGADSDKDGEVVDMYSETAMEELEKLLDNEIESQSKGVATVGSAQLPTSSSPSPAATATDVTTATTTATPPPPPLGLRSTQNL